MSTLDVYHSGFLGNASFLDTRRRYTICFLRVLLKEKLLGAIHFESIFWKALI